MKKIEGLKQGDKIYDIDYKIKCYKYLCIHPSGRGKYHILIDEYEKPLRIYCEDLQKILNKNLNTYEKAKMELIKSLEEYINFLRS